MLSVKEQYASCQLKIYYYGILCHIMVTTSIQTSLCYKLAQMLHEDFLYLLHIIELSLQHFQVHFSKYKYTYREYIIPILAFHYNVVILHTERFNYNFETRARLCNVLNTQRHLLVFHLFKSCYNPPLSKSHFP